MTTEGTTESADLIPIERDLDQLLQLDSYQGMTDTEIEKIIAHKELIARNDAIYQAAVADNEYLSHLAKANADTALEQAQANFETACSLVPGFVSISEEVSADEPQEG